MTVTPEMRKKWDDRYDEADFICLATDGSGWTQYDEHREIFCDTYELIIGDRFEDGSMIDGLLEGAFVAGKDAAWRAVGRLMGLNPEVARRAFDMAEGDNFAVTPDVIEKLRHAEVPDRNRAAWDILRILEEAEASALTASPECETR